MLKELYDYALENDLILPAGFIKKKVHAYVLLAKDGKFLSKDDLRERAKVRQSLDWRFV